MATLNIRLDENLKEQAYLVLDKLGVSPSELVRSIFRYVAEEERLPIKLALHDRDNFEATKIVWVAYSDVREQALSIIDQLKTEKNIQISKRNLLFTALDRFNNTSTIQIIHLVLAKEWSEAAIALHQLTYKLKYAALSSRLGDDFAMYTSESINDFSNEFYQLDLAIHDLMLNSRYL